VTNLEKRCLLNNIKLFKVNPMYSSVIGNVQHNDFDPINAALEISRRGYHVIILKDKQFYPVELTIKDSLKAHWKEHLSDEVDSWKKLFSLIKKSKLRYRVSLEDVKESFRVFQVSSIKSNVTCYNFKL